MGRVAVYPLRRQRHSYSAPGTKRKNENECQTLGGNYLAKQQTYDVRDAVDDHCVVIIVTA